jgi:hypothetical protein
VDRRIRRIHSSVRTSLVTDEADERMTRGDAELLVGLLQVVLDRAHAEEQARGDVAVGGAARDEVGDVQLLRGQLGQRARRGAARDGAGRPQLGPGAIRPRLRAERGKGLER